MEGFMPLSTTYYESLFGSTSPINRINDDAGIIPKYLGEVKNISSSITRSRMYENYGILSKFFSQEGSISNTPNEYVSRLANIIVERLLVPRNLVDFNSINIIEKFEKLPSTSYMYTETETTVIFKKLLDNPKSVVSILDDTMSRSAISKRKPFVKSVVKKSFISSKLKENDFDNLYDVTYNGNFLSFKNNENMIFGLFIPKTYLKDVLSSSLSLTPVTEVNKNYYERLKILREILETKITEDIYVAFIENFCQNKRYYEFVKIIVDLCEKYINKSSYSSSLKIDNKKYDESVIMDFGSIFFDPIYESENNINLKLVNINPIKFYNKACYVSISEFKYIFNRLNELKEKEPYICDLDEIDNFVKVEDNSLLLLGFELARFLPTSIFINYISGRKSNLSKYLAFMDIGVQSFSSSLKILGGSYAHYKSVSTELYNEIGTYKTISNQLKFI